MMDTKHTPGPWRVGADTGHNASFVYSDDGAGASVASIFGIFINRDLEEVSSDARCAEGLANARLIAATPELLEALMWARTCYCPEDGSDMVKAIDAALAKALGQ